MHRICVFAGSNSGIRQEYQQAARALGQELIAHDLELVYGGASVGLMGIVADTMLASGGKVTGVLPKELFRREVAHRNLTTLHEVSSMHERKALMADLSDGFIALPGGLGTFDELFEITSWAQLGLHSKPIGLLNISSYFEPLLALIAHAAAEGFVPTYHAHLLLSEETPNKLLERFYNFTPRARQQKWTEIPPDR